MPDRYSKEEIERLLIDGERCRRLLYDLHHQELAGPLARIEGCASHVRAALANQDYDEAELFARLIEREAGALNRHTFRRLATHYAERNRVRYHIRRGRALWFDIISLFSKKKSDDAPAAGRS